MSGRRGGLPRRLAAVSAVAAFGLLAGCSSSGTSAPPTTSASGPSVGAPSDQYADSASLVGRVASLVPKPTTVTSTSGTTGPDPVCPVADVPCVRPSYSVDLAVADGEVTGVVLVTESVAAVPDVGADPCAPPGLPHLTPGYHCVVTTPWTQRGAVWLAGTRVGATQFDCRQETVVRRGRTAVVVSERLSQDSCGAPGSGTDLAAAAPLDAAAVERLALATPLVRPLASFTDVAIAASPSAPSPSASSTVPVAELWQPSDGTVTEEQFVARASQSLPAGVRGERLQPLRGSADDGTLTAAFAVSRDNQAGLLVLGEDGGGSSLAVLNTCVGYRGCTQLVPWTKHGEAWTAVFENVDAETGVTDRTAYVVRGSSAFGASSRTQVMRADDTLATLVGAQPLLSADELLTMVTSLPLGAQELLLIRRGSHVVHRPGPVSGPRQPQWPGPLS